MAVRSTSFANYNSASTATINVPAGAASGDIVVVDLWVESSAASPTPPAGFTLEASKSVSISGVSASIHRFWKRLTGSDTGSYSFTLGSSLPYMAIAVALTGRATSGSPFGTAGAATATFGVTGSRGSPGAVSAASAAAGADALLAISGYDFGDDPTVVATGFTRQVANGDGQYLFANLNMASGQPGSVTPGGPSDAYLEVLSILPVASGSSSFAAAGTVAGTSAVILAVNAVHPVTGTVVGTSAVALAVNAVHPVSGTVAGTSSVSLAMGAQSAAGTVAAVSGASLAVNAVHPVTGTAAASSAVSASVNAVHAVSGTVAATSAAFLAVTGGANPFPATVHSSGRYLVTGTGEPWPMFLDSQWNLLDKAASHGEGATPLAVFQGYAAIQAANGFNAVIIMAVNSDQGGEVGSHTNGATWDNVAVWGAGGIGDLNPPYWARLDSLIDAMADEGITVILDLVTSYTLYSGTAFDGLNNTNAATFGTAIGNRYKNVPNIIYGFGVDYFANVDTQLAVMLSAIRATGDTHLATVEYYAESSSRIDSSGATPGSFAASVDFDDVYAYSAAALEVRRAYAKTPARPTQYMNGHYYQGSSDDKLMDDLMGWALTSGSKGMFYGSEAVWQWGSGAYAALSSEGWPNTNLPAVVGWFTALAKWHLLVPDLSSTFITSSRGTDATAITPGGSGGQYSAASTQNNYLTGAVTADGTLGLIYTPTSRSITIDTSKLVAGFTAKWVDPESGTMTPTTAGSSYTHPGNNSAGHAGWYLLLQGQITSGGTVAAVSGAALSVTAAHPVTGSVTGTSAVAMAATLTSSAAGSVAAVSAVSLTVTAAHPVSGSVDAVSGASLNAVSGLALTVAATSTISLTTTANLAAQGSITATSGASLTITAVHAVSGTVTAVTSTTLTLAATGLRNITVTATIPPRRWTGRIGQ